MPDLWPDTVDEVLGGDQAVMFAQVTPAAGVVLTPLTNFGVRDREAGTMTPLNSSVAMWKKLERLQENPRIAIAYHTRKHGFSDRPEYILVQGRASLSPLEDRGWLERNREQWERAAGPSENGRLWDWWLRIYHWRVAIGVEVERLVVWPDLDCQGEPQVFGAPRPSDPPQPQREPGKGTGPRVNHVRAARRAAALPDTLLGWVDADGFPFVVPVEVHGSEERGIVLETPAGAPAPPGGRRAGMAAHDFARYTHGQNQRRHSGWLEAASGERRVIYAPHTAHGYYMPWSETVFRLSAGFETRRRYRLGRRAGFLPR
jgi:hypothetical protein